MKRLHDRDRTGWWLAAQLLSVVVAAGLIGAAFAVPEDQSALVFKLGIAAAVLAIGFGLWLFVELGCLKGTQGVTAPTLSATPGRLTRQSDD